jgi:gas vesicle protein
MKTKELQTLWWDWLGTSERLLRSLHEQTAALTLRDVARVERIQPELDTMLERMKQIDGQAAALAKKLAEEMGVEPNLRGLVSALEKAEAQQVQSVANRVMVVARNVQHVLDKNRALIENEMQYINGTLSLLAKTATEKEGPYRRKAQRAPVLVDQAA